MRIGLDLPPHFRVFGAFFIYSFGLGGIFPRFAEIQSAIHASQGEFGLALTGTAFGTLTSLTFGAKFIERFGHRLVLLLIPLAAALYLLASFSTGPVMLFVALLPVGLIIGCIEIIINLEADRVEHQVGRRIMNRAHGFWSFGIFVSGFVGAGFAQAGISPQLDLLVILLLVIVGVALLLGRFTPAPARATAHAEPPPRFARPTGAIFVLVLVTLAAMVLEGAGFDWSAIYMRDEFQATPFLIGLAPAVGALLSTLTRFFADRFVERFSPASVARTLLAVLGAGAVIVYVAPNALLALAGLALLGIGTAVIFPLAMSAAAQRTDRSAAINVAALAQTSFVVYLLGPPLLGQAAQHLGVRSIFGIALPLVVLSLLTAGALGRRPVVASPVTPEPIPGE